MPGYFISNVFVCIYIYLLLNTAEGKKIIQRILYYHNGFKAFYEVVFKFYKCSFRFHENCNLQQSSTTCLYLLILNTVGGMILQDTILSQWAKSLYEVAFELYICIFDFTRFPTVQFGNYLVKSQFCIIQIQLERDCGPIVYMWVNVRYICIGNKLNKTKLIHRI